MKTDLELKLMQIIDSYSGDKEMLSFEVSKLLTSFREELPTMEELLRKLMYFDYREEMMNALIYYGYVPGGRYVCVSMEPDQKCTIEESRIKESRIEESRIEESRIEAADKIIHIIVQYFEMQRKKILYTREENVITFMLPIPEHETYKTFCRTVFQVLLKQVEQRCHLTISVGIGTVLDRGDHIMKSASEAKEALFMLHACHKQNQIRFYEDMGIYRLLFEVKEKRELQKILETVLGNLMEYDQKMNSDLVHTLDAYLMEDCNMSNTALSLYVHRNTVKYKIAKIEEILKCDLRDVNVCFNLRLAYKIKRFLGNEG